MSLGWYMVDINSAKEGLDPLLPQVAGVIEIMEEATITDIKNEIERDTDETVPWQSIISALENGVRLGLFRMEREFKVCREFTSKDIQKVNNIDFTESLLGEAVPSSGRNKRGRSLMDYVKTQREKRRRKMYKGKEVRHAIEAANRNLYAQLCQRCKKSVEKKITQTCAIDSEESSEEENQDRRTPLESSSVSGVSEMSDMASKPSANDNRAPQRSRLLVEKNPMETDSPYYDILM